MRRFYQKDWFGIKFESITTPDPRRLANASFYEKFYEEFYKKFSSYDELPVEWKAYKKKMADFILQQTNKDDRLLSIGCGNGYIEYLLGKSGSNLIAVDPSLTATRFLRQSSNVQLYKGYFPWCLNDIADKTFDLAYMMVTDYVFNKKELINLLQNIKEFRVKSFLLVSVSLYDKYSLSRLVKDCIKRILSYVKIYEVGQFWGYNRTPAEFIHAFTKTGFKNVETGFTEQGLFWIKGY